VEGRAVVVAKRGGYATLRIAGVALAGLSFCEDDHMAGGRQPDGRPQPRNAAANDQEVRAVGGQSARMLS